MDNKIVIFEANSARIIHAEDTSSYLGRADVLINPKIPSGIPPHCWKLEDGKITTHTDAEIARRRDVLHGPIQLSPQPQKKIQLPNWLLTSIISSSITAILLELIHRYV